MIEELTAKIKDFDHLLKETNDEARARFYAEAKSHLEFSIYHLRQGWLL